MKIVVLTSQKNLLDELEKSTEYKYKYTHNSDELFNKISEKTKIILLHLDSDQKFENTITILNEEYPHIKKIALRDAPNNIEGCNLLKKNFQGYMHSFSNHLIIEDGIQTVLENKVWVYPELMQFLINAIPVTNPNNQNVFESLSTKELEVLELVAQGNSNAQISQILEIAEVTVKKHISSLFKKLDQKDRLSLALFFKNHSDA